MHLHEILDHVLGPLGPLFIVETGSIRNADDNARVGDGWSTLWFAQHQRKHHGPPIDSIDLSTAIAQSVISERELSKYVDFHDGYSVGVLAQLVAEGREIDVVFLDSDNDARLILDEYMVAKELVRPGGVILVDDVRLDAASKAVKGDFVLPYITERGFPHQIYEREGWNGYRCGVLAISV